jgi:hypothetical protein
MSAGKFLRRLRLALGLLITCSGGAQLVLGLWRGTF